MYRLLQLLWLLGVVVLFLMGYLAYGLAAMLVLLWFRILNMEKLLYEQSDISNALLQVLSSNVSPEVKEQEAYALIKRVNDARAERLKKDSMHRMRNFGLKKGDAGWVD